MDRIKLLYDLVYQREPTAVEIELGLNFLKEAPPPEMPDRAAVQLANAKNRDARKNGDGGGKKNKGPAMSLANIPAGRLMPVGAWVKYAHAPLQANEAMFID